MQYRDMLQLCPELTGGAIREIQMMLQKGLHRRNATSSLASFAVIINSKETWKQFFRGLHKAGVTVNIIREKKDQIVNLFQGPSPPVVVEEVLEARSSESSTSLEGSTGGDPSKAAKAGKQKRSLSFNVNWVPLNVITGPLLI